MKVCISCGHAKSQHSINGCYHGMANGQECPCTVKSNQPDNFEDGRPLND